MACEKTVSGLLVNFYLTGLFLAAGAAVATTAIVFLWSPLVEVAGRLLQ